MDILLIGNNASAFATLTKRLGREDDVRLLFADSGGAVLEQMREKGKKAADLVIVGGHLADMAGIQFIRQLMRINPLVNTAVVGSLPDETFHEATEGLGVLLQLPPQPREHDAEKLLSVLRKITGLMQPKAVGAENL